MAYEKYIKKNGKLYGPYTYHSKRVNGKVVSEYHGATKKASRENNFIWIIGLFIGLALLAALIFLNVRLIGKVSLDLGANVEQGGPLEGVLSLGIKEGELIPASSKVLVNIGENSYEYALSDLVEADTFSGNYYVEGKTISGSGSGYGISGAKTVYSEVDFTLNILSESGGKGKENGKKEETPVEMPETPEEEIEEEEEVEEEIEEEEVEEEVLVEEEEEVDVVEEEPEEEVEEEQSFEDVESIDESVDEPTPITAAVIAGFFKNALNAFLVLTGQVSLQLLQEVDGSVSFGESFSYELGNGESAEIKSDSVKVNGEVLSDTEIDLDIIDNKAVVTTEYSIEEKGFGEDYLGDVGETLSIGLTQLGLTLDGDSIIIKIVYDETELVSVRQSLIGEEIPDEEIPQTNVTINVTNETEIIPNITNQTIINETITNETITNETIGENVTVAIEEVTPITVEILNDEERAILEAEYEDIIVDITKAERVRDRIEVTFKIGSYSVKHSYDSSLSEDELNEWIDRDRIRLLKDIAYELSVEESSSEAIDGIVGSYAV